MSTRFRYTHAVAIGGVLAAMGGTVLAGWLLQIPNLVQFNASSVPMVFNTALCFTLTGLSLLFSGLPAQSIARLHTAVGAVLVGLCSLTFAEILADRALGIDWPQLHIWLGDGNVRPGRMAPNTALGFIAIGLVFLLLPRVTGKWRGRAVQGLTFAVLTIGLTGLAGYALAPDLLYGWARSARMAVPTALGMAGASCALWLCWHNAPWFRSRSLFREDDKIVFIGMALLGVVAVTAALTGFVLLQNVLGPSLRGTVGASLDERIQLFHASARQAASAAQRIARQSDLSGAVVSGDARRLAAVAASLHASGLREVTVFGADGRVLARAGVQLGGHAVDAPIPAAGNVAFVWDGAPYFAADGVIDQEGRPIGTLRVRLPLNLEFPKLLDTAALGATGKAQLCFDGRDALACVPPQPGMPLIETPSRTRYGKTLAIAEAMQGRSGLAEMLSTAGVNVVAAYGPVAPGLALAIEQDTAELYTPIRVQFKRMLWILLGLVAGGMLLLRSQLKPLARRLLASETLAADKQQQLATLLHSVGEGILSIRADGAIVSANPAACTIFASTEAEMLTTRLDALIPADMNGGETALSGPLRAALRTTLELRGRRCDGTDFDLELGVEAMPLRGQDLYVAIVRDITQRKEAEQRLTYLARYDSLTGLPNRSLFLDRLGGALTRSKRSGMAMALMYLDLDGFKQINDTLGHQSGDLLLQQFAARLQAAVRESDTVARLAGDEFTIVLENLHDAHANAAAVAAKVLQAMQLPFNLRGGSGSVTASIGTVIYSTGDATLDILLSRADAAMYRAKHQGKNQVVIDMETAGV